jgi:hypothetical protein
MIRIPDLPALTGTPGIDSMVAFWSASQDRTFQATARDLTGYYNVKLYGAVGDGVTDDTAAIQAALNACQPKGGVVWFPVGSYNHTGLTVSYRGTVIAGESRLWYDVDRGTELVYTGSATGDWLTIGGSGPDGFRLENINLTKSSSLTLTGGRAVAVGGTTNAFYRNVKIIAPYNGMHFLDVTHQYLDTVIVESWTGSYGIKIEGTTSAAAAIYTMRFVWSLGANYAGDCFRLEGNVASVWTTDCYARAGEYGVHSVENGINSPGAIYWRYLSVEQTKSHGIYLEQHGQWIIDAPWVGSCGATSIGGGTGSGIVFGTTGRHITRVVNGHVGSAGEHGYLVNASAARIMLLGCNAFNCSVNTINTYDGVNIAALVDGCQINGGMFGGNSLGAVSSARQRNGVTIQATATKNSVLGVDLRGNVSGTLADAGTGTVAANNIT